MKFEAVLFDLDGTLLNTLEDLADSCNEAMRIMGYPEHTVDEVRTFINNGARRLVASASPAGTPEDEIDRCLAIFQAHYRGNMQNKTRPYPGVMDLLRTLSERGVKVAVVSNKFDGAVKPLCKKYFGDYVQAAIGEHEFEGVRRKPWPDTAYEALKALGVKGERALYAGDSDVDVETAKNAGLPCLAVSWGFRSRQSLVAAGAEHITDRVEDFIEAMERMQG